MPKKQKPPFGKKPEKPEKEMPPKSGKGKKKGRY